MKIKARLSHHCCIPHSDVNARRLTRGVIPSRAAEISALSSIAPSSVTPSASEHDCALKFYAVTAIDSPFTVTIS